MLISQHLQYCQELAVVLSDGLFQFRTLQQALLLGQFLEFSDYFDML
jgi:hypothetical protein